MANVDDVMSNESFFVPSDDTKPKSDEWIPLVPGEYYGHIIDCILKESIDVKGGKYRANVYNFFVKLAPENKNNTYKYTSNGEEKTTDGSVYEGKRIKAFGVWRFLEPTDSDTFESNAEANKYYMMFCESIGIKLDTKKANVGGKDIEVKVLPKLEPKDINGKAVVAVIGKGKPWTNKEGKEVKSNVVRFVKTWEDGQSIEIEEVDMDDIPF